MDNQHTWQWAVLSAAAIGAASAYLEYAERSAERIAMPKDNGSGRPMGKVIGDDADAQERSATGFMTGVFTGALIGAGVGLLFAPRAGADLRGQLAASATSAGRTAAEKYQRASRYVNKTVDQLSARGRQAYDEARSTVSKVSEEAGRMADNASAGHAQSRS